MKDFIKDNEGLWTLIEEEKQALIKQNTGSKVRAFVSDWLTKQSN
jgi:hypothetical protein